MLASIAHRASGVILVLSIPVYLWLFAHISGSEAQFSQASIWLHNSMGTWFLWISGSALAYHWFNGLRFLLLDMGKGESRTSMKRSATWVIAASFIISAALGILLWL